MNYYKSFKKYKKFKFSFFFFFPLLSITETKKKKYLPNSGDLVVLKFFNKYTGIKLSFFKIYLFFGICITSKIKSITSNFILRNIYRKNAFEMFVFLYSPLISYLKIFCNKRKFFSKACLFFLRLKKLSFTKIFL